MRILAAFILWISVSSTAGFAEEAGTGTITGKVVYEADASRPWRYARYYVAGKKTGQLAEAVVALAGKSLKDFGQSTKPAAERGTS